MTTTRAILLAACVAFGIGTQAAATAAGTEQPECLTALSTASIADIDQVIQELQILRDDKATKEAGKPAPLTREEQLACTFPDKGKVGMMKGGKLGKGGGYSEKTRTFPACRDACMDDGDCLAFQWSEKRRHCGLKDTGDLYMSVLTDTAYRKSFQSFKRVPKGCTPATTTSTPGFVERVLFVGVVLPTVGANITVAAVPDTGGTPLSYIVTLNIELELNNDTTTSQFKADFATDVGAALAIGPAHVVVNSLKLGSLVVGFTVKLIPCVTGGGFRCDYVGDGYCDGDAYNTAAHMYDGGDCCPETCTQGNKTPFYAVLAPKRKYVCGGNGYTCKPLGATGVHVQFYDYGFITTTATTATTTSTSTSAEPTTTPSTTSTATAEPTTTVTTTAEPTTTVYCSYTNSTTFEQAYAKYFMDVLKGVDKECAINTFDTSAVTTMFQRFAIYSQPTSAMLKNFNENINGFNTNAVTTMAAMFKNNGAFNQTINGFATSAVTAMNHMFNTATSFNQNINGFNTGAVSDMTSMFSDAEAFNQNINGWNTGAVTTTYYMFAGAKAFDGTINGFNTSAVTDMYSMFDRAAAFNQNINGFNTGAVTTMAGMFSNAASFNQNLNGWNTGAVTTMRVMFSYAVAFNQNISAWDTGAVTTPYGSEDMFAGTTSMDAMDQPEFNFQIETTTTTTSTTTTTTSIV